MMQFSCRKCYQRSEIDHFRSRYDHVCLDCYRKDVARKNVGAVRKYARLKYQVKKINVVFDISFDEFSAYQKLNCHYCGSPVSGRSNLTGETNTGSGLDRKNPNGGYTNDNVVPACFLCNRTKNCWFSYDEMLVLGKTIRLILDARSQS